MGKDQPGLGTAAEFPSSVWARRDVSVRHLSKDGKWVDGHAGRGTGFGQQTQV